MTSLGDLIKNRFCRGVVTQPIAAEKNAEVEILGLELKAAIKLSFKRSFNVRQVDTGDCGACLSEIIACNNPIYDLQRFGVNFVASPRHADALLVTGPVTKNMELALKKTYDAMPEPKLVITLGECAKNGGIFGGSHAVVGGVEKVLPVAYHIPGCPPKPVEIIRALLALLV